MITAIRKRAGDFAAILFLVVVAAVVGGYILHNQRLRFPYIQEKPLRLNAAFSTAQAVTPGQGQTVRVAGVRIGDIANVTLKDGQAIVGMDIDPQYEKSKLVHTDATALLRTKTGLKDMFIEVNPGTNSAPVAKEGWTMPVNNTLPDVNPDEVLSALDADTRDYLKLLVNGAGRGLNRRGGDLQEVFARFEPTYRDVARLTGALQTRRSNLRRLIHSLNLLNTELAASGSDLTELVDESAVVFRAFASEQKGVRATIRNFPPALRQTTITLGKVETFANVLRPTADRLRPAVRAIAPANTTVQALATEATPTIRDQIRPFVRRAQPLVNDLVQPVDKLANATPSLTRSFQQLNNLFDLLGYNPGGREKAKAKNINEGWLFHIAWVTHQTEHLFTLNDANGSYRPVFIGGTCGILKGLLAEDPTGGIVAGFGYNFLQILANPALCPPGSFQAMQDARLAAGEHKTTKEAKVGKAKSTTELPVVGQVPAVDQATRELEKARKQAKKTAEQASTDAGQLTQTPPPPPSDAAQGR